MRNRRRPLFVVLVFIWTLAAHGTPAVESEDPGGSPELPIVRTDLSSVPTARYVLAVDGHSSRTVLLDTASHTALVFDRRGREDGVERLQVAPTFSWDVILAMAIADGGDVLALTTSGGIALFEDFQLQKIVPLDRPPSVATDFAFERGGDLLFSRMLLVDPALFDIHETFTILALTNADGKIENVAFPIEPKGAESYLRWTSQRQVRIAVDEKGAVWVADDMAYRIRKLSTAGRVLEIVENPDETATVENDPDYDPAEGHGRTVAGEGQGSDPTGESLVIRPVIRDIAAAGGYLWVLARDDAAPGGERLDIVRPGTELERVSLPFPSSMKHIRSLGVTRRFVVLCTADEGRPVTLDRDELERLAERRMLEEQHDGATAETHGRKSRVPSSTPSSQPDENPAMEGSDDGDGTVP